MVAMSEAEQHSGSFSRLRVETASPAIQVVSGTVEVFAEAEQQGLLPLATCSEGSVIVSPASGAGLLLIAHSTASVSQVNDLDDMAVQTFIGQLAHGLGSGAETLVGVAPSAFPQQLAAAIHAAAKFREERAIRAVETSLKASGRVREHALNRARFEASEFALSADEPGSAPVVAVMQLLAEVQHFSVVVPSQGEYENAEDKVRAVAHRSNIRFRTVTLDDAWNKSDVSSYLGWYRTSSGGSEPVALIRRGNRYTVQGADDLLPRPVTHDELDRIDPEVYEFYTPFDPDRPTVLRDILRVSFLNTGWSWMTVLLLAFFGALLGLLTPILTQTMISRLIPDGMSGLLWAAGGALAMTAVLLFVVSVVQNLAVGRISQLATRNLQAAFWDRLLSLPVSFFRRFNSGELAVRALAIDNLSRTLSVQVVSSLLTAMFGFIFLVQMMLYDVMLGLAGSFIISATVLVLYLIFVASSREQTSQLEAQMAANGWLVQMLTALPKLRIARAEDRMSARYFEFLGRSIMAQSRTTLVSGRLSAWFALVTNGAPAVFYAVVLLRWDGGVAPLTTATFLAFYVAFTIAFGSISGLAVPLSSLAVVAPMYRLLEPVMTELPESNPNLLDPGHLSGKIEFCDVWFRYAPGSPLVLKGLSFVTEPAELVAIVGTTGAGKSTLARLLLAFEQPEDGQVLLDGRDLSTLDPRAVRHQMGVVTQNGRISRGTVLKNILGAGSEDEDTAWEAAEGAAVADDIRAMPMGMHTLVDPGNISGGQAQRLLIARALVTRPKIMIMDEATSALDNAAQEQVTEALSNMKATRLVIAHRLSTVRSANRIVVLDNGTVVESGKFDELMNSEGFFAGLVRRQVG
jgi:NHLM bacteriocin system ABC transporter ATP-binding protein